MERTRVSRATLVGVLVALAFGALLYGPRIGKMNIAKVWAQTGGTANVSAMQVPVGLTIYAKGEDALWLSVLTLHEDSTTYGSYRTITYEWQFREVGALVEAPWAAIATEHLYRYSGSSTTGHTDSEIAVGNLNTSQYAFRVRAKTTHGSVPVDDRVSAWSVPVAGLVKSYPERWLRNNSVIAKHIHPGSDVNPTVEAHRVYFDHKLPTSITAVSSYEYVLIPKRNLLTLGEIRARDIVPSLENYGDLDRGKPFTYNCSVTVCFAGLPADSDFYVAARAVDGLGRVTNWSITEFDRLSKFFQFRTQTGSSFTPTPTGTPRPGRPGVWPRRLQNKTS